MYMYMSFYGKKCTSQWIAQVLNTSVKQFPQFPTETATFCSQHFSQLYAFLTITSTSPPFSAK